MRGGGRADMVNVYTAILVYVQTKKVKDKTREFGKKTEMKLKSYIWKKLKL